MKYNSVVFSLLVAIIYFYSVIAQTKSDNCLKGPYLGQTLPNMTPEIFAPGIVSTDAWEAAGTFSPDGKEFFFTRRPTYEGSDNRIYYMYESKEGWSVPDLASFAQNCMEFEPHVSPDGKMLFYNSQRYFPEKKRRGSAIWRVLRKPRGWDESNPLGSPINDGFAMYVTSTNRGDIYFTGSRNKKYGIFMSPLIDGKYTEPVYLPEEVNYLKGAHPFIAPDESFLIFDSQAEGILKNSLYISFHNPDGSWTKALKLPPAINATQTEMCPSLSPDGKFFFFHRTVDRNGEIFWVDAEILNTNKY